MGKQKSKQRRDKAPSAAERARRAQQRAILKPGGQEAGTPVFGLDPDAPATDEKEEALHVDSKDWREAKIQGREEEITEAAGSGDTARAKQILEEVRANAGGCDICSAKPEEGDGFVLSSTKGRVERRWGHRECLMEKADRWLENGQAPLWTKGTSIFDNPTDDSIPHAAPQQA